MMKSLELKRYKKKFLFKIKFFWKIFISYKWNKKGFEEEKYCNCFQCSVFFCLFFEKKIYKQTKMLYVYIKQKCNFSMKFFFEIYIRDKKDAFHFMLILQYHIFSKYLFFVSNLIEKLLFFFFISSIISHKD